MRYRVTIEAQSLTGEYDVGYRERGFLRRDGTLAINPKKLRAVLRDGGKRLRWPYEKYAEMSIPESWVPLGRDHPDRKIESVKGDTVEVCDQVTFSFTVETPLSLEEMQRLVDVAGLRGFGVARIPFNGTVTEA